MKKKRKIIMGVIVSIVGLFFVLVFLSLFFMLGTKMALLPESGKPIPPNSVDRFLDKMEFGAIAFTLHLKSVSMIPLRFSCF